MGQIQASVGHAFSREPGTRRIPAAGLLQKHRMVWRPIWAHRDELDWYAKMGLQRLEIRLASWWQFGDGLALINLLCPARMDSYTGVQPRAVEHRAGSGPQCPLMRLVRGAEFDFVEPRKHIEEGNGQAVRAAYHGGVSQGHEIDPATASGTTSCGAIFVATVTNPITDGIVKFSGEWASSDPSGICLDHADHTSQDFAGVRCRERS